MTKKIFLSLGLLLAAMSSLHAQTADAPSAVTSYPIGTMGSPVIAAEYCCFLTDSMAPQLEETLEEVQEKFIGNTIPISVGGNPGSCTFWLVGSQSSEVIKGLPTREAQQAFNEWQKNPFSKELLSYLNDQVQIHYGTSSPGKKSGYSADAAAIKTRYLNSQIFLLADSIGSNYAQASSYYFVDERGKALVNISRNTMLVLDQNLDKFSNDYHRPATIQESN